MVDDWVAVLVEKREFGVGGSTGLVARPVDFVAAGVFAFAALGGKENRIILAPGVVIGLLPVVLPLLDEKDTRLGSGVRLEGVGVKAHDGKNATLVCDEFADFLICLVVEPSLRKDNRHASAGPEEVDVALDEKDVAADALLGMAVL